MSAMLLLDPKERPIRKNKPDIYEHCYADDLESICWVLLYEVMQNLSIDDFTDMELRGLSRRIFDEA